MHRMDKNWINTQRNTVNEKKEKKLTLHWSAFCGNMTRCDSPIANKNINKWSHTQELIFKSELVYLRVSHCTATPIPNGVHQCCGAMLVAYRALRMGITLFIGTWDINEVNYTWNVNDIPFLFSRTYLIKSISNLNSIHLT